MTSVPRIARHRRQSRVPLLLQLIWLRFRLRATLWRAAAGRYAEMAVILPLLAWLWLKLQAIRAARRLLDRVLPPGE